MKKFKEVAILFFLFSTYQLAGSQSLLRLDDLSLFRTIPLNAQSVHADTKQQTYILTQSNEVMVLNSSGRILHTYSNNYLGKPQFVYIQNPLQVILFYPDFQRIIILDNALNELSKISLSSFPIPQASALGYASDKGIWFFDEYVNRIKKINQRGMTEVDMAIDGLDKGYKIAEFRINKNEILITSENGRIFLLDGFGKPEFSFSAPGKLIEWNERNFIFFNALSQKIITWYGDQHTEYSTPDGSTPLKQIAVLQDGIVGLNEAGDVLIFHYRD